MTTDDDEDCFSWDSRARIMSSLSAAISLLPDIPPPAIYTKPTQYSTQWSILVFHQVPTDTAIVLVRTQDTWELEHNNMTAQLEEPGCPQSAAKPTVSVQLNCSVLLVPQGCWCRTVVASTITTVCPQKSEPLNILKQQPQICSDLNKISHTRDDICCKHYYTVSYKSALTVLKYEFLNNITNKSWVSIAVDVSQNSQNVHIRCLKCPLLRVHS